MMQEAVESAAYLREQAAKCLRLAKSVPDPEAIAALRHLAMEYEDRAKKMDEANGTPNPKAELPPQT